MPLDAKTAAQTVEKKSLSQLVAGALMEISPETAKAITDHPDSSALAKRVQQALGIGQPSDVMSPQEKLRYLEAVGTEAAATESTTSNETPAEDDTNRARLQAISDMALEAQRLAADKRDPSSTTAPKQEEMVEGLINLLKKGVKSSVAQAKSDANLLKDIISADIQKRMK